MKLSEMEESDVIKSLEGFSEVNPLFHQEDHDGEIHCIYKNSCKGACISMTVLIAQREGSKISQSVQGKEAITKAIEDEFIMQTADCECPYGVSFADRQDVIYGGSVEEIRLSLHRRVERDARAAHNDM